MGLVSQAEERKVAVAVDAYISLTPRCHTSGFWTSGLTLQGLTFWGFELNVILLAEGGWEDGMGGGMVAEPV